MSKNIIQEYSKNQFYDEYSTSFQKFRTEGKKKKTEIAGGPLDGRREKNKSLSEFRQEFKEVGTFKK